MTQESVKKRVAWLDIAKGLTILLVIIGHTIEEVGRGIIFSFHMPLFFVLSCVTYRYSYCGNKFCENVSKAFKHLILPAYFMVLSGAFIRIIKEPELRSNYYSIRDFLRNLVLSGVFASGVDVSVNGAFVLGVGIPWFLVVLFIGRSIFDYWQMKNNDKRLAGLCLLASFLGIALGRLQCLPLSLDISLAIMPLFYVGKHYDLLKVEEKPITKFLLFLTLWGILFGCVYVFYAHGYLEVAQRRYTLYPLCFITAICGTVMMTELSVLLSKSKEITATVGFIGKNSLYLLIIHYLDSFLWAPFFMVSDNMYINAGLRVAEDVLILIIIMVYKHYVIDGLRKNDF